MAEFDAALDQVLRTCIDGYESLEVCERLSGGASQETYRIRMQTKTGARLAAMRRAPGGEPVERTVGHPGLAAEAKLFEVAHAAGIPEPEVYHVLRESDGLGEGFIMQWLDGEALGARINRSPELDAIRPHLARQCGEALARIHAIDLADSGLDSLLDPMTPAEFVQQTWDRYKDFETPQPMIDFTARWLMAHLPSGYEAALVHNDFRNGNIMVDPTGIVAVLDWEIAHIGDPMRDLGWICTNSWRFGGSGPVGGFGSYEDLFAGYETVSGTSVDPERVKFWEVFGSFWWAVGCLGMAEHYRNGPDQTVERPGIGRRSSECQVDCVNLLIPGPVELIATDANASGDGDMPRIDELVVSVRDFLHGDVMANTEGRTNFLARVAGNSLDIVLRDLALGPAHRARELARLHDLLGSDGVADSLEALRWKLTLGLRDGSIALDVDGLDHHLRTTVVNQIAIDQPKYSGFKSATK